MPECNPLSAEHLRHLQGCLKGCASAQGLATRMRRAGLPVDDPQAAIDQLRGEAEAILQEFYTVAGQPSGPRPGDIPPVNGVVPSE